ncbi:amino acid permease [Streptomyces sp. x-19]|uniref:amino acid permease n=1 Tax=Streptomyces sp. x-19 TaxID=2789280 RepID=UPI00397F2E2A
MSVPDPARPDRGRAAVGMRAPHGVPALDRPRVQRTGKQQRAPRTAGTLRQELSGRQLGMIALGGAIGTGLFLGSGQGLALAGPVVVVAYAAAAVLALAVTFAVAEMASVHPEAGGFGAVAHAYLGPMAGFVQRWTYWGAQVVNIGSEAVAAGLYTRFWWPDLPLWVPVAAFSAAMVGVNALSVRFFGEFEYWFAMVKVCAIVAFVLIGVAAIVFGLPGQKPIGASTITAHGGLAPNGLTGLWMALCIAAFSYIGTETLSLTAAEARNPSRDIPRAARATVFRLALFYVLSMCVVVAIVPWTEASDGDGVAQSPFVRLFGAAGVPAAAAIMNLVVLTAALSAMNTNLFATARTLHSLGQVGQAPARFARLSRRGTPLSALLLSTVGALAAVLISAIAPAHVFPAMISVALFNALITWLLIFATHLVFHRARRAAGHAVSPVRLAGAPVTTVLAMASIVAVLVTMAFTDQFRLAILAGLPCLAATIALYPLVRRKLQSRPEASSGSRRL